MLILVQMRVCWQHFSVPSLMHPLDHHLSFMAQWCHWLALWWHEYRFSICEWKYLETYRWTNEIRHHSSHGMHTSDAPGTFHHYDCELVVQLSAVSHQSQTENYMLLGNHADDNALWHCTSRVIFAVGNIVLSEDQIYIDDDGQLMTYVYSWH